MRLEQSSCHCFLQWSEIDCLRPIAKRLKKKQKRKAEKRLQKKREKQQRRKDKIQRKKEADILNLGKDLSAIEEGGSDSRHGVEAARDLVIKQAGVKSRDKSGPPKVIGVNSSGVSHPKHLLKSYLATPTSPTAEQSDEFGLNKPIADLYPNCTVCFMDIVGFTAWSSEREPEQVFTLRKLPMIFLENIRSLLLYLMFLTAKMSFRCSANRVPLFRQTSTTPWCLQG